MRAEETRARLWLRVILVFFFQAEDGIRDYKVTGVQTCALPIWVGVVDEVRLANILSCRLSIGCEQVHTCEKCFARSQLMSGFGRRARRGPAPRRQIGRASCRERG